MTINKYLFSIKNKKNCSSFFHNGLLGGNIRYRALKNILSIPKLYVFQCILDC